VEAAVVFELIHAASLIHDDVVDGAAIRRGEHSLNGRFGERLSVLVGDCIWARAFDLALEVPLDGFMPLISRTATAMSRGELASTSAAGKMIPLIAYLDAVADKTASLFEAVCVAGGMATSAGDIVLERLRAFGRAFGMRFQFQDDLSDFLGVAEGKPSGLDACGGRATLPLILAWEHADEYERNAVSGLMPADRPWDAARLRAWTEDHGGVDRAKRLMQSESDRAVGILDAFPDSAYRQALRELIEGK
jgi:octaprenyl-diphosphate synthase